jgi:flagellar motor switch protein FliN/FliY
MSKTQVHAVKIELSVVLGRCSLPMHRLLRMGRGAVIPLDVGPDDNVWVLANGYPIARGEVSIQNDQVAVVITGPADVHAFNAVG